MQLAWQAATAGAEAEIVTADIPWDVEEGVISHDRRRMVFAVNENGMSRVYLLDTATRRYKSVNNIPTGLAFGFAFSPDDRFVAMTLNSARTPSDTFVLELGDGPLHHGELVRWTSSEVGGLETAAFRPPELVHFPTFDSVDGEPRQIPAWVFKPAGEGRSPSSSRSMAGRRARPGLGSAARPRCGSTNSASP